MTCLFRHSICRKHTKTKNNKTMALNRTEMADVLHELQYVQTEAFNLGIHSFEINSRVSPYEDEGEGPEGLIREYGDTEERYIVITVFLRGDDTDEDYESWRIWDSLTFSQAITRVNEIRQFINHVLD